jgi:TolB-like protein
MSNLLRYGPCILSLIFYAAPLRATESTERVQTVTTVNRDDLFEQQRLLVLEFHAGSGVIPDFAQIIESMLISQLHKMRRYEVMSRADVQTLLGLEQQKQLLGCDDALCMSEIAGSLGADKIITGTVANLGEQRMLTLKLINSAMGKLDNQLIESLPADDDDLNEAVRQISYKLFKRKAPALIVAPKPWYMRRWVWAAGTALLAGAGGITWVLSKPEEPTPLQNAPLGEVILDAP